MKSTRFILRDFTFRFCSDFYRSSFVSFSVARLLSTFVDGREIDFRSFDSNTNDKSRPWFVRLFVFSFHRTAKTNFSSFSGFDRNFRRNFSLAAVLRLFHFHVVSSGRSGIGKLRSVHFIDSVDEHGILRMFRGEKKQTFVSFRFATIFFVFSSRSDFTFTSVFRVDFEDNYSTFSAVFNESIGAETEWPRSISFSFDE